MGQIAVLDENMVNMIAAGEVIERPASVVKELLENSIDAGATKITVSIEDGGRKLISVTDDGCGMDADDLSGAFEPHATSKIKTSGDLAHISTMGFRGEALASIASVSQVKAVSRTKDSIEANFIEIDCGKKGIPVPCSGSVGTAIEVRNIFYKTPARRKFLRTANTEMTHIIERFTRIGLGHCELGMTLLHNGRELYTISRSQRLQERIGQLLSRKIADGLIETRSEEKDMRIFALLGRPDSARSSGKFQYVFLNSRFIRDRFISHAIKQAYQGLIEPNKFPLVFLFLQMPYELYDVNVHPTKIEVRFDNPNLVHSQILGVLREKLLSMNLDVAGKIPQAKPSSIQYGEETPDEQARKQHIAEAMAEFFKTHKPVTTREQLGFSSSKITSAGRQSPPEAARLAHTPPETQMQPKYFQLHNSYIVAQTEDGFIVIDQHALHERIIYEDLCRRTSKGKLESQRLLIPESFELTDAQADALKSNGPLFEKLGIEIEPFGPKTVAVQAFPVLLSRVSPLKFVGELLDLLIDKTVDLDSERLLHEVLDMTACKAAIKAGQKLSDNEIESLLKQRGSVQRAVRCPHGRPTTIKFSISDLQKQFKRT